MSLVLLVIGCENVVERADVDVENADLRALPAEVAVAVESHAERLALEQDSKGAGKAIHMALGFSHHRGIQSARMGETIDPALFQETHNEAQRLIGEIHGKPGREIVEEIVAEIMLTYMIPAFKEGVDSKLKLSYVRLLVDNTSKQFPIIIASLETTQDQQAEVAELARRALVSLQVLEIMHQRRVKLATERMPVAVADVEKSWPPSVKTFGVGRETLDVEETRSRLTALTKR